MGKLISGALVFPTAFAGTLMILDYPGPPGPFGLLEFVGWWAVCVGVAKLSSMLFASTAKANLNRILAWALGLILPITFAGLLYLIVQPNTPIALKRGVEYSLQVTGLLAVAALVVLASRGWTARQDR